MIAVCVDPAKIAQVWPHFSHLIRKAVDKIGIMSFEALENDVLGGRGLLWLAYDGEVVHAAAVTQLVGGICEIVACGGSNLPEVLPLIEDLESFARDEKCTGMRIIGRKGWLRVLKDYKTKAVILERPL
jgi:hypothetical protein